jgi:hypothetical protein
MGLAAISDPQARQHDSTNFGFLSLFIIDHNICRIPMRFHYRQHSSPTKPIRRITQLFFQPLIVNTFNHVFLLPGPLSTSNFGPDKLSTDPLQGASWQKSQSQPKIELRRNVPPRLVVISCPRKFHLAESRSDLAIQKLFFPKGRPESLLSYDEVARALIDFHVQNFWLLFSLWVLSARYFKK